MTEKFLIIADDFTGANDTGVQFRRYGYSTVVLFAGSIPPANIGCAVIDTESRAKSPDAAEAAVRLALEGASPQDFSCVIKKVDSTLRGNIPAEIHALDEVMKPELVIFMPALPDLGRTTKNGIHLLMGKPITETELAKDPKMPVQEAALVPLLKQVYSEPIRQLGLPEIRGGSIELSQGRIYCCDAETNEDMCAIISAAQATGKRTLWVGSAAIADNLMRMRLKLPPVLGIVASLSTVSANQVKASEKAGVAVITMPFYDFLSGEKDWRAAADEAAALVKTGKDVILVSSGTLNREDMEKTRSHGQEKGLTAIEVSEYVQDCCGRIGAYILERVKVSGVFLSGGDTAMGLMNALNSAGSEIISEISVGIPLMKLVGGQYPGLRLVTKAGAFGEADAINFAFRKLKEKEAKL